ncbi:MAG TPA: hypothetical protein VFZ26_10190 [Gemmatimonadales bacterium]
MSRATHGTGRIVAAGTAAAALLGAGWLGATWMRYGRNATAHLTPDPLLDRFMPDYEVREQHQTVVAAPAETTWAAARGLDLLGSPLVRAIFRGRELLMGSRPAAGPDRSFLDEVQALGWRVLAEEPGRELVMGAVTQPWKADVEFRGLPPEEFAGFTEPGYARIAWTLAVEPIGAGRSIFRTETRVATTDPDSRRRFRRYWTLMSPGILLIRRESLRLVRREAERR